MPLNGMVIPQSTTYATYSSSGVVKKKARIPATLTPKLTAVAFGEKEMNLSPSTSLLLQSFELEAKVKWVKTGRRKTEG